MKRGSVGSQTRRTATFYSREFDEAADRAQASGARSLEASSSLGSPGATGRLGFGDGELGRQSRGKRDLPSILLCMSQTLTNATFPYF